MAYQSLYRRYRSQRFEEVLGQDHVTRALRNAVREGRVAQAYLFSGPRGTGKTSTARILAKVLNCDHPADGEPDTTCESCRTVQEGRNVDWLQELDAASNNGVDAMRDLLGRVSMGTSGTRKVYVLDEVHMLSTAASNALLKTLEEPPAHVVFVLATTEPEKVLPTIRSRTQHFEFNLLPADVLADHVRHVIADADLVLPADAVDDVVDHVVRAGRGSARDVLSALDQVAAAGGVTDAGVPVDDLVDALGRSDAGAALLAVDAAVRSGRDPRVLAEALVEALRHAFLHAMGAPAGGLTERAESRAREVSQTIGPATLTRALESVGAALVEMRHAPDPRIPLEVALVQLTRPEAAGGLDALRHRVDELERAVAGGASPTADADTAPAETPGHAAATPPAGASPASPADQPRGAEAARARLARHGATTDDDTAGTVPSATDAAHQPPSRPTLGAVKQARSDAGAEAGGTTASPPSQPATPQTASSPARDPEPDVDPAGGLPTPEELTEAWRSSVLESLGGRAKALYKPGRFVANGDATARFALPNEPHLRNCVDKVDEVRAALEAHFGRPVPLELVVDDDTPTAPTDHGASGANPAAPGPTARGRPDDAPGASDPPDDPVDLDALTDAPDAATGGLAQLQDAFPGAELEDS